MYKQIVRDNSHTITSFSILVLLGLCLLAVLKSIEISFVRYDFIENIVLLLIALSLIWSLFISRTEYVYQKIDNELILKKTRGKKDYVECAILLTSIQSIHPVAGISIFGAQAAGANGFCGDPLALFSNYAMVYKTGLQKRLRIIFQPNEEMLRLLKLSVGDKLTERKR
jgi:hypothetical protein